MTEDLLVARETAYNTLMPGARLGVGLLAVLGACRFDTSGIGGDDDAGQISDAAGGDGSEAPDALPPDAACGWSYTPTYFDPCAGGNPEPDPTLNLYETGTYHYDTDTGVLTSPTMWVEELQSSIVDDARVVWLEGLAIFAPSTLRVEGTRPLVIVSTGAVAIFGTIDASSHWDQDASGFSAGAGSEPDACPASPPDPGQLCAQHGGSGGGAGAFGGDGGDGGEGGDGRDCGGGILGLPGGAGGIALALPPDAIRGGCNGRDGSHSEDGTEADRGLGGPGGGAVHLTARTTLLVRGTIHAGGAGGRQGLAGRAGGGGGGSGGFIGLEADAITLEVSAILAANGGGGGGGVDHASADPGEDGGASGEEALGGAGDADKGGDGGDGGFVGRPDGQAGALAERGGGGGGGGVGFIALYSPSALDVDGDAVVSPAYVTP